MDRIFKIKKESPIHKVVIGSLEDYFDQENIQHSKYARIKIRKYICVNELLMKKLVELFNLFKLSQTIFNRKQNRSNNKSIKRWQ